MDDVSMAKIEELYLSLLRAAIFGRHDDQFMIGGQRELTAVIQLAAFQGTGPLVYDQLLKMQDLEISSDLRMQMKQQCVSNMMQQQVMISLLKSAWKALVNAGIQPVLLKGFGLAQCYPQPYLRQWGDMDVYVGAANYHLGCSVLRNTFPGVSHTEKEDESHKHYNFEFGNAVLEMHRISMAFAHPQDRKYYEHLEERYLTKEGPKTDIEGLTVTLPEDTFNVFFVFLHAWHHFSETGMNMKQLCDVAVMLHAKSNVIDQKRLKEMLSRLYLMEVWQSFMYIMVHYLGLSIEECPYYTVESKEYAELLFSRVIKEGTSRIPENINADGASYIKRKWLTFQSRMGDSRLLKLYAPRYARHLMVANILHGIERIIKGK